MAKKKKVRVDLRKNRSKPPRPAALDAGLSGARLCRGGHARRRAGPRQGRPVAPADHHSGGTRGAEAAAAGNPPEMPAVDRRACLPGRVLRVHGLASVVETEDGRQFRCAVRRLLRTLATDERNIVATGDRVWFRPAPQ